MRRGPQSKCKSSFDCKNFCRRFARSGELGYLRGPRSPPYMLRHWGVAGDALRNMQTLEEFMRRGRLRRESSARHLERRTRMASPGEIMTAKAPAHGIVVANSLVAILSGHRAPPPHPLLQAGQLKQTGGGRQQGT